MPRFKPYSYAQTKLIPIDFSRQIRPGTFEFALNHIVDGMDLSVFHHRFRNDDTGAPAYDPAVLLKIVFFAYSRGIISSREIARECTENVTFMALSADTRPHFTTIAAFISSMETEITPLFLNVLAVCADEGLIGGEMFAIDGCKISSNCSKEWSGTRADFERKKEKIERSIQLLLRKHKETDENEGQSVGMREKEEKALERLTAKAAKFEKWLESHEDKKGARGNVKQSNITDNESAKMPSSHGVIQGYSGLAAVDSKHQVIVAAEAFGEGQEHALLKPMLERIRENFSGIGETRDVLRDAVLVADNGLHSEENVRMVMGEGIDAYLADNKFRKRDPTFAGADRHKRPVDRHKTDPGPKFFRSYEFIYDESKGKLICPAGKELYVKNSNFKGNDGHRGVAYMAKKTDCRACKLREKCLREPHTEARQVVIFTGEGADGEKTHSEDDR